MGYKFSTSLMCMNLLELEKQIKFLNEKSDYYHVDIMDGHFVKNLSLSPFFIKQIKPITKIPIDAHLMVERPNDFISDVAKSGANCISVHSDTIHRDAFRTMNEIRDLKCKVGVVLNPATIIEEIKYYINLIDKVTIMTVDPGYAGQPFIPEILNKLKQIKELKEKHNLSLDIEVDGACNSNTFKLLSDAGAEVFILGSTGLFNLDTDLEKAWDKMIKNFSQV
ncbi:MAG: D-allulose 6-phosphate 3-epimerase [Clostridia bacterium]